MPDELEDHIAADHPADRKNKHGSSKEEPSKKDDPKVAAHVMKADSTKKDSTKQKPNKNCNIHTKDEQGKSEKDNIEKDKDKGDKSKECSAPEHRGNLCKNCQCYFPTKRLLHKHITLLHPGETAYLMEDIHVEQGKDVKQKGEEKHSMKAQMEEK